MSALPMCSKGLPCSDFCHQHWEPRTLGLRPETTGGNHSPSRDRRQRQPGQYGASIYLPTDRTRASVRLREMKLSTQSMLPVQSKCGRHCLKVEGVEQVPLSCGRQMSASLEQVSGFKWPGLTRLLTYLRKSQLRKKGAANF